MAVDYSIPLIGIQRAERSLEQAAVRITTANLPFPDLSADSLSLSDFAAELIAVDQAKTAMKANFQVISTHGEILREVLDLFA
jgi:hypothetical protein